MSMAPPPSLSSQLNMRAPRPQTDNARPCPGLPTDAEPCGNEKSNGGYCTDCRKRYQRQRYANKKGGPVREYTRTTQKEDPSVFCGSCGSRAPLGNIRNKRTGGTIPAPAICEGCFDIMGMFLELHNASQTVSVAKFIVAHREALDLKAMAAKDENVMRILYARWYEEEIRFQEDFATPERPATPPNPRHFNPTREEYEEVAKKLSSSGILEETELVFEVVNAGGNPERTRYHG
jgi:hypothetical protein